MFLIIFKIFKIYFGYILINPILGTYLSGSQGFFFFHICDAAELLTIYKIV